MNNDLELTIPRKRIKNGFNLIEAAIVLGVVGLVVGGIWIAAATVRENMKVNLIVTGVGQTIENVRSLNAGFSPAALYASVSLGNLTSTLYEAKAFPSDFVTSFNSSGYGVGFWSASSGLRLWAIPGIAYPIQPYISTLGEYYLTFWGLNKSECYKVGAELFKKAVQLRINELDLNQSSLHILYQYQQPIYTFDTVMSTLRIYCNNSSTIDVHFGP